jgi:cytochrome c biogenesis protein CcmG/thiol:disulfide interchange protein DsbE
MNRKLFAFIPLFIFAICVVLFSGILLRGGPPSTLPSAMIGKQVPAFSLPSAFAGAQRFSDADLRGGQGVSVVNVFASWCVPCKAEQPALLRLSKLPGVRLYGIAYKDRPGAISAWLRKNGNPYALVGFDAAGRAAIDWGVYGVPETFVVDAQGVIRARHVGPLVEGDDIDAFTREIREAMP